MRRRLSRGALLLAGALLAGLLHAAEGDVVTDIFVPQRPAAEWLPVLQPLAGDEVSVQAWQGQLILRGPPARVQELRDIVQRLDRPLRNLRISVRRSGSDERSGGRDRLAGDADRIAIDTQRSTGRDTDSSTQTVTLTEGGSAFLSTDTEVPVLGVTAGGALVTTLQPLGNGLELRPVAAGAQVRLEIRQRHARPDGGAVASDTVQSVLLLQPGVWTALGSVSVEETHTGSGALAAGRDRLAIERRLPSTRRSERGWDVRVDLLD